MMNTIQKQIKRYFQQLGNEMLLALRLLKICNKKIGLVRFGMLDKKIIKEKSLQKFCLLSVGSGGKKAFMFLMIWQTVLKLTCGVN